MMKSNISRNFLGTVSVLALCVTATKTVKASESSPGYPQLHISGHAESTFYTAQQNKKDVRNGMGLGHGLLAQGGIEFSASGQMPNREDVWYNLTIGITGDANPSGVASTNSVTKSYVQFDTPVGSVMIGNNESPVDMAYAGAANVFGGCGGWNGNFTNVINQSSGTVVGDNLVADPGSATMIVYSTPDHASGLKFMLGFCGNTSHLGGMSPTDNQNQNQVNANRISFGRKFDIAAAINGTLGKKHRFDMRYADPSNGAFGKNAISLGLSYHTVKGDFSFGCAVGGLMEKSHWHGNNEAYNAADDPNSAISATTHEVNAAGVRVPVPAGSTSVQSNKLKDAKAFQIGIEAGYKGFEAGLTYTDNCDSRVAKRYTDGKYDAGKVISGAVSYSWKDFKVSAGASHGKRKFGNGTDAYRLADGKTAGKQETTATIYSVGMDYTITPGWKVSAEFDYGRLKTCERAKEIAGNTYGNASIDSNTPKVFMVSTSINF